MDRRLRALAVDPGLDRERQARAVLATVAWCAERIERVKRHEAELYALRLQAFEAGSQLDPPLPAAALAAAAGKSSIAVTLAMRKAARARETTTDGRAADSA